MSTGIEPCWCTKLPRLQTLPFGYPPRCMCEECLRRFTAQEGGPILR
ncbi:MAG: hypothetical protein JNJ44_05805 [Zoogloeaceae bacterium]|nr:hypothetical protein [Zoogloeaceae bacterium]